MAEYGPIMMSSIISQKANYLSEFGEGDVQIQELVKKIAQTSQFSSICYSQRDKKKPD